MKKITLLLLLSLFSINSYSQLALEGFESGIPGTWAVFDNGVGTVQSWTINSTLATPPLVYQGNNAAYVNRENIGQGNTSEDYLATPLVTIPTNGQLHFYTRSFTNGNQGTIYQVKVAPASATQNNPAAYTLVQQWDETTLNTTFNIYEEKVVSLSAYAGQQVYVSFVKVYTQPTTTLDGDRWLVDNVSIIQQCLDPTALTANGITQTSANLSWGNPSGATSWEIEVVPSTGTPTGTGIIYNGTLPYTATSTATGALFTSSTAYKYYVRALCSSGGSSLWVGPFQFSTTSPGLSCAAPIIISTLPYSTTDNTANYSDNTTIEGSPGASGCGSTNSYLNGNDVVYSYTATSNGVVNITMTPTATYSGIFVYNSCANIGVSCIAGVANSGTTVRTFDLNVTAGTTYYIVISTWATPQTTAYTLTLQKVNCPPPTTLSASNIGQNSAQLSWSNPGGATSWQVAVQTAGSPIPSGSGIIANTNTNFQVTGLSPATNYQYYVRADCGDGTFSVWSGPYLFTTNICDVAQQCNYSFIMNDSYGDGWNGGTMQVKQNGIVVATLTGPTAAQGTTAVTVLVPLCHGIPFELFWNNAGTFPGEMGISIKESLAPQSTIYTKPAGTGTANTLLFSGTVECFPASCPKPNTVTTTSVTQTSASISWTESGTATQWEIIILPAGSPTPLASATGTLTTSNPYLISGLTPATNYDVYVRAICSSSDISFWSPKKSFTTPIANDECTNATLVPVNNNTSCTVFATGSLVGATASTQVNTCSGTDDDDVWFQFTATSTQHFISLTNVTGSTTDLYHVLYTGSCGSLTQLYCSDANDSTANNLTIGQVYYIRVYSYTSTPGQTTSFNVCIKTPVPPPACINNQPAGNTCATATPICNLNGYCGSTSSTYTADYWSELLGVFCGTIENNSFLKFTATSTSISFDVWVTSSQNNDGIQILIYSANNCAGTVTDYSCWSPGVVPVGSTNISASGLVVGNTYYIMIDGYAGDVCDYVIAANTGIQTQVNVTSSDTEICLGETVNLGATGGNGNYVWTPATGLGATTGSNVTFTPTTAGTYTITATSNDGIILCPQDVFDSVTITVNPNITPTFDTFGPYCAGDTVPILPTTSNNGITGTWNPTTIDNTQNGSYTFTPTAGLCATPITIPIVVNPIINPIFDATPTLCYGETAPILATTSNNAVSGIWSPATVDNTQSGSYIFTPNSGQCATTVIKNVTVNQIVTPTFLAPAPICNGDTPPTLPTTSLNGITGTWSPTVVDNTQTATYTFTPNSGQCANTTTMAVTVYQNCAFGSYASAVWLTNCADNNFFNTVGSGSSIIGPAQNIFTNNDFGTYISNSNTFKLRGAEVKTFKNATANVCSARLNYRIYPQSGTPGAFTVLNLPFFNNCSGGSFPSGGPCNPGDQKWQKVLSDSEFPVDLTAFPAGDYVLEVFYDITGDVNSTTQCDDTILINNNGANFIATYTLQENPTYTFTNPTSCNATDGTITINNLAPNTTYSLNYTDNGSNSGLITINTNSAGQYTINGLNAGTYTNFNYSVNSCTFSSTDLITLVDQPIIPTFDSVGPICSGDTLNPLPTISNEGITGTWSPALNNTATTTYTFTPDTVSTSSTNLIVNGDFTQGNTGFSTDYQYLANAGQFGVQKAYGIVSSANNWFQGFQSCSSNAPSAGNMMVVDGSTSNNGNDNVWGQTVTVTPNKTYTFSYWLQTIATPNPALIEVKINGVTIGSSTAPISNCQATQISYTWNSGNNTSAQIEIFDRVFVLSGNDFSLDDISFIENITSNNQCAVSTTLTITVNQPTAATFNAIPAICSGGIAPTLPTTSIEGFTGTWSPSIVDNTQTLPYTFTPTAGQCATQGNVTVTVNPNTTPVFAIGTSITACQGVSAQVLLPTTSDNGITGTWNPSTLDYSIVGTTIYTFTPTAGLCANNTTLTVVINPNVTPTFTQVAPICIGGQLNALPTTSIEGITGTWSPSLNNLATTIYTFTPTSGQCALTNTMTITVNPNITPTFNSNATLCVGETAPSLPTSSIEGITGTWTPSVIDNTASGTYTFVPTIGQCATNGSLSVTVQSGFDFEITGGCVGNNFVLEVVPVNNSFDSNTASYAWYTSNQQSVGNNSTTFNVTEYLNSTETTEELPISFNVTVTNPDGCLRNESITLDRIYCGIQKGISVNNDDKNDFFDLRLLDVKQLTIFNRYGMKVYSKGQYKDEWKGQSDSGDDLPDGTYYYVIEFNNGDATKTGWIYKLSEN